MVEQSSPKDGVRKEVLDDPEAPHKLKMSQNELYASTKAACYFLATEFSRREPKTGGVIHVAGNPGNYATNLWVHVRLHPYFIRRSFQSTPHPVLKLFRTRFASCRFTEPGALGGENMY